MKKYLLIIFFINLVWCKFVYAENITCKHSDNNNTIKIFYDTNQIKAAGKTFKDVFVSGNSMSGTYFIYKSLFLGVGSTIDESWRIDLSFDSPKAVSISRFKHIKDNIELLSDDFYIC